MSKLVLAIALAAAIPAFAHAREGRQCRAILLGEGNDDSSCVAADNELLKLSDEAFTAKVCDPSVARFSLDGRKFLRSLVSSNLLLGNCEWEVRANSGHADGFLADTNIIFRDPPQFGACDPSRDTGTRYVRDEEVCVALTCGRYQLFSAPKYAWVDPQPVDDRNCR